MTRGRNRWRNRSDQIGTIGTMSISRTLGVASLLLVAGCGTTPGAPTTRSSTQPAVTSAPVAPAESSTSAVPAAVVVIPATAPRPLSVDSTSHCIGRAEFGDPADSLYVLPFPPGERYRVSQSYCFARGGHSNQLAYDFVMPIGDVVTAARAGTVMDLEDDSPDDGQGQGQHNFLMIRHEDGSVAFYAHLQQEGLLVGLGDEVVAGQSIAFAGNSGLTGGPHLHFGVYRSWPPREGYDAPIVFRNSDGPLDLLGGLVTDGRYEALSLDTPSPAQPERPRSDYSGASIGAADLAGAMLWGYDFSEADLSGADLSGTTLSGATMTGTILVAADLSYADLDSADLSSANLRGADLKGANLGRADLSGAGLQGANLSGAYLAVTDLRGADLTDAVLEDTRFIGALWDETTLWPDGFDPPPRP